MRRCLSIACMLLACERTRAPAATTTSPRAPTGLYWGRWGDVPDGVRVQVWLHGVAGRVRGAWELPPWRGEFTGSRGPDGRWRILWREAGVVAGLRARERRVTLTQDVTTGALRGDDVALTPAGAPAPTLGSGMWLARWTGLPPGMAVETVMSRDPGGRWRAAYRYQEREGMFEGDALAGGGLAIRWREVSLAGRVAQGRGLLLASDLGLLGTYGVGDATEGTGYWSLEPVEVLR